MDNYDTDLTHKIETSEALIRDAGAADKDELLQEAAKLLNDFSPDIICEYKYGGIDVFRLDAEREGEAYEYSRITVKRGADNLRYGSTYDEG